MASQISYFSYSTMSGKKWGFRFEIAALDGNRRWIERHGYRTKEEAAKSAKETQDHYEQRGNVVTVVELS